jgi:hypothetical protein
MIDVSGEVALFVWHCVDLCVCSKTKCATCTAVQELKNKKCGRAKNKNSLSWLSGRAVGPIVSLCVKFRVITFRLMVNTVVIGFPLKPDRENTLRSCC